MNRLSQEKSPYLLQHKDNPVSWWPWGAEAFAEAARLNKPVFLSVGYSTCHWCHVMEVESFEVEKVAEVLNQNFISIKVDREERPDIDDIYMKAVQRLTGRGGWPMSVWLTPEGFPFFAGTYFPKENFIALNQRITEVWRNEKEKVMHDADRLRDLLQVQNYPEQKGELTEDILQRFSVYELSTFEPEYGGFSQAPKFPAAMTLMTLMRIAQRSESAEMKSAVKKTLDGMARGGIYDHLAGGFHRYSTDQEWLVPHFEKMLYDNALLSLTYLEAHLFFSDLEYARVARETLDYLLREMASSVGGFCSAQDADSLDPNTGKKEEGYFCTFSFTELESIFTDEELDLLGRAYGITRFGHYEGRNILHLQGDHSREEKPEFLFSSLKKLRSSRPLPHLDDKILVGWNGLAIAGLSFGYRVLKEDRYLAAAQQAADFILRELYPSGKLMRRYRDGDFSCERRFMPQ